MLDSASSGDTQDSAETETESTTESDRDSSAEHKSGADTESSEVAVSSANSGPSSDPSAIVTAAATRHVGVFATVGSLAKGLVNVVGSYTGAIVIPGVAHNRAVNVSITRQSKTGSFKGVLIPTADTTIHVAVSGTVSAGGKFTIKLVGTHSGGSINGTGTGTIGKTGGLVAKVTFVQSGQKFPGTLKLAKA